MIPLPLFRLKTVCFVVVFLFCFCTVVDIFRWRFLVALINREPGDKAIGIFHLTVGPIRTEQGRFVTIFFHLVS